MKIAVILFVVIGIVVSLGAIALVIVDWVHEAKEKKALAEAQSNGKTSEEKAEEENTADEEKSKVETDSEASELKNGKASESV